MVKLSCALGHFPGIWQRFPPVNMAGGDLPCLHFESRSPPLLKAPKLLSLGEGYKLGNAPEARGVYREGAAAL